MKEHTKDTRTEQVRFMLASFNPRQHPVNDDDVSGFITALDCLVESGPRVPPLKTLPDRQTQAGEMWNDAIFSQAWPDLYVGIDEENGVEIAPTAKELIDGAPRSIWLDPPFRLVPEWWSPLTPWLSTLVHQARTKTHNSLIRIYASTETAKRLAEICALERTRQIICASPPTKMLSEHQIRLGEK